VLSEPVLESKEVKKSKIDKLDVKIDDICQSVFALQQPVASFTIYHPMQISREIEKLVTCR
jgi:phosphate transport system protein